ncbi:MAG: iron donor protein CyaY [Myxococcota bacterium]
MDEKRYREVAFATLRRIEDLFEDVDVDVADVESSGDVVTISYANGKKCIVNTQGAVQQLWLAGGGRGWHFDWQNDAEQWLHDKGTGDELFSVIRRVTKDETGVDLPE